MTSYEWCCTSTVIVQTTMHFLLQPMICFLTQIWDFIKVAVTLIYDFLPATALDKVVTFASEVGSQNQSTLVLFETDTATARL